MLSMPFGTPDSVCTAKHLSIANRSCGKIFIDIGSRFSPSAAQNSSP